MSACQCVVCATLVGKPKFHVRACANFLQYGGTPLRTSTLHTLAPQDLSATDEMIASLLTTSGGGGSSSGGGGEGAGAAAKVPLHVPLLAFA